MSWVLIAGAWLVLALLTAVVIGRSIRIADIRADAAAATEANFVVDPAAEDATQATSASRTASEPPAPPPLPAHDPPTVPGLPVARPSADRGRTGKRLSTPPARRSESA